MRLFVSLSFSSLLILICCFGWISSVPLSKNITHEVNYDDSSSSESIEDYPTIEDISDEDYSPEESAYVVVDDMIVQSSRAGLSDAAWPNGVVPYTFGLSVLPNQKTYILQAMAEIHEAVPCVSFRPMTKEDTYNVEYRNDGPTQGCSSYVGWQNRKNQPIQLATICSKGNAIHEIMHALGFFHEQTRDDRDEYVTVNMQNIQPGAENNFRKDSEVYPNSETDYFNVPYNYDSIMHYGKTYFSKNNQNTIDVLYNPNALGHGDNIGQRDFISEGDMRMMRAKYECPAPETEEPSENVTGEPGEATEPAPVTSGGGEGEETAKPTTKNPLCTYNPNLPQCKQQQSNSEIEEHP